MSKITSTQLGGYTVTVNKPIPVSARVKASQVRCFETKDCASAADLAAYVSNLTGQTLGVNNRSAEYGKNVKNGYFEIWLAPGPLTVNSQITTVLAGNSSSSAATSSATSSSQAAKPPTRR